MNRELIRKPPSRIFWVWSSGLSKTIMPPSPDLSKSSITVLRGVPGETSFMKSKIFFSFSDDMFWGMRACFYSFMWRAGGWH